MSLRKPRNFRKWTLREIPKWNTTSQPQRAASIVAKSLLKKIGCTMPCKFTNGSEMLNVILMNQREYRDKTGLCYKHKEKRWVEPKVKPYLKFFHKVTSYMSSPFSFCSYCNRKGHSTSTCNAKKHDTNSTHKWVPKETKLPKDFPRQDTKGVRRSRAWKPFPKEIHPPRAC